MRDKMATVYSKKLHLNTQQILNTRDINFVSIINQNTLQIEENFFTTETSNQTKHTMFWFLKGTLNMASPF